MQMVSCQDRIDVALLLNRAQWISVKLQLDTNTPYFKE